MTKIKWSFWNPHEGFDENGNSYVRVGAWQSYAMSLAKAGIVLSIIITIVVLVFNP